ncbi:MAG: hypothetical protein DRH51_03130 [Candidatus Coatesbacteria bacterium]|nr:MAG: hypothetical protein DRH51_03130 [Candidatus Coatesbacteria bacterium]
MVLFCILFIRRIPMRKTVLFSLLIIISIVVLSGCKESQIWVSVETNFNTMETPHFTIYSSVKPEDIEVDVFKFHRVDVSNFIDIYSHQKSVYDVDFSTLEKAPDVSFTSEITEEYGGYHTINVTFDDTLDAGFYLVRASMAGKVGYGLMEVTDTRLMVSWTGDDYIISTTNAIDNTAISGLNIYAYYPWNEKEPELLGKTDESGHLRVKYQVPVEEEDYSGYFYIYTEAETGPAFCYVYEYYYYTDKSYTAGHIYTDRPIYRPDQDVNFKIYARDIVDGRPINIPGRELSCVVRNPQGDEIFKEDITLSDFGTAHGGFHLDEDAPLGYYYIEARIGDHYFSTSFEVQEYRKPEFIVEAIPDKPYYLTGDTVNISVDAEYYFGGVVKGAEVNWNAYDYYNYEDIEKGSGVTTDDGKFEISFRAPEYEDYNYYTQVNIEITDQSRRMVTTQVPINVYYYDINLSVYTDRYLVEIGDEVGLVVNVSDLEGNPISKDVLIKVEQEIYNEDENKWEYIQVLEDEVSVGKAGKVIYDFEPEEAGYYRVLAETYDSRGHKVDSYSYFWVTGGEYAYWWWYQRGIDAIILDKEEYEVGDTALVQINVEPEFTMADIIISGAKIYDVYHIPVENHQASLEIPIKEKYYPNISVALIYPNEDEYYGYYYDYRTITVKDETKELKVNLSMNKDEYRPGEEAKFTVKATDYEGNPEIADVCVAMVDEALYAISEEDKTNLIDVFYPYVYSYLEVSSSNEFYFEAGGIEEDVLKDKTIAFGLGGGAGGLEGEERALEAPSAAEKMLRKAGEEAEVYEQPRVRREFKDTGYWVPMVVTSAGGVANITFTMPDNLTTWRTTVRGITKDTLTGETREKVITTKKLIVRLITPRTFTQNDEVVVSAVVTNYLPVSRQVKVYIEGDRVRFLDDITRYVTVGAGDTVRVDWRTKVLGTGESTLTAYALTDIESDAMEVKVPITPHGLKTVATDTVVAVDGTSQLVFNIPADVRLDSTTVRLDFAPSIASAAFNALEYLAGYPYGCVEQTMSMFLPDVYLVQILQKTGLKIESPIIDELPKMIDDGLTRLYDMQHDDGGWGWWKEDRSDPYMTSYVLYGLATAMDADIYVRQDVLAEGVDALKNMMDEVNDPATICYMLYAISYAPDVETAFIYETVDNKNLMDEFDELNSYALACLGTALVRSELHDSALIVANELKERAIDQYGFVHWDSRSIRGGWYDSRTEATAYALRFFIEMGEEEDWLKRIAMWLVNNRRGYYWYSTKDTSACVMALADYVDYTGEFEANYTATVSLNGEEIDSFAITRDDLLSGGRLMRFAGDKLKKGDNKVVVNLTGEGRLYSSYQLTYYTPGENIKAVDNGIVVERTYVKDEEMGFEHSTMEGEKFTCYLTMKVSEPVDYVMLEDFLPAGCEFEEDIEFQRGYLYGWGDNYSYYYWYLPYTFEARDDRAVFFFTHLNEGEYRFAYKLRAETPGVFHTMPAVAYAMYSPDFGGSSNEVHLKIAKKRAD